MHEARSRPCDLASIAAVVLRAVRTEHPNKPADVVASPADVRPQRAIHPAFYGCFDWHSAVHGHWTLVRLLARGLAPSLEGEIRAVLAEHLSADRLAIEAAYFREPHNRAYERMYGWAWVLCLAAELRAWDDDDASLWSRHLAPLEAEIVGLAREYLPRLAWPIRSGVHSNTAFALALTLDYARAVGDASLAALVESRTRGYFGEDRDAPIAFEPSGEDFLSPALAEADLVRRVLDAEELDEWLGGFLPGLAAGDLGPLGRPVERVDIADGRLGHLAGLNLSRAWAMRGVASALSPGDAGRGALLEAADAHLGAGLASVESGHYEGEHWLGTFAVYALTSLGT